MKRFVPLLVLGSALGLTAIAHSSAPPKPGIVPVSWELEFEYQPPQPITLRLPGQDVPRRYWYMLYTVTNKTKSDQYFIPDFTLSTLTGQVLRAGQGVSSGVFEAIQKRHNNPLLVDQATITGRILQGDDNAKYGVAIWPEFDPEARSFDVFIGGLSGERAEVELPATQPATTEAAVAEEVTTQAVEEGHEQTTAPATEAVATQVQEGPERSTAPAAEASIKKVTLSKSLRLRFDIPGEAAARDRTPVTLVVREWVMR